MLSDNGMRRKLTLFLVLFLLATGIFIIAFHHHDDDCDHDDCPICIAAHQVSSVTFNFFPLAVFYIFFALVVFDKALFILLVYRPSLYGRAPPI